jgi:hypothetical protein
MLLFITSIVNAQLKMNSSGNIGIGLSSPNEKLEINGNVRGNINGALRISSGYGYADFGCQNTGFCHISTSLAKFSIDKPLVMQNPEIYAYVHSNGTATSLSFYTNNTCRMIISSDGSTGIGRSPYYLLDVAGTARVSSLTYTSDERLKDGIVNLDKSVDKISKLRSVSYKYNRNAYVDIIKKQNKISKNDSLSNADLTSKFKIDTILFEKQHYGFLAQELQTVFPELVYEDNDGVLSIDYIGLIPIMIQTIQEQSNSIKSGDTVKEANKKLIESLQKIVSSQEKSIAELQNSIVELQKQINACCSSSKLKSVSVNSEEINSSPVLYQNSPNPFSSSTLIKYYIPSTCSTAIIYLFSLQGKLIKSLDISIKGEGSVSISGSELDPGMYLYSLVVDGKEVDSKRMILTK